MSVCRNCEEKIGGYCHGCMNNTVDTLTAQLTALEQELADEKKAAGYWMEQSCKDHNRAEKAEAQLSRYQGAVEVEVEGMKVPNWRESSPELKAAWFEFKSKYTGAGTPCLSSFAAGWNMQKQQAHRRGWEQAKREAVDKLDYLLQNSFGSRAMLDIAHAHISSMEYKETTNGL